MGRGGIVVFAISAVDVALWDLKGRLHNEPLWRLLGGETNRIQAYAGGVDLYHPLEQLLDQTRQHLVNGFRAIKMKVGRNYLREDVERVQAMRELIGPDVILMVDANMQWRVDQAITELTALKGHDAALDPRIEWEMALTHAHASDLKGMRAAGVLAARMQKAPGIRIQEAKVYVADKLNISASELAEPVMMSGRF